MKNSSLSSDFSKIVYRAEKTGSRATRSNRNEILKDAARQIKDAGFRNLRVGGLKPKHIDAAIAGWRASGIADRTLANRVAVLRFVAKAIHKENIVPRTNAEIGIERGQPRHSTESKAVSASDASLAIANVGGTSENAKFYQASLTLCKEFGLRREEAQKIVPEIAHKGDFLELRGSWCKGGRPRDIRITTEAQRNALARAKEVSAGKSLIPSEKSYIAHSRAFQSATARQGISAHQLRHAYAQNRYQKLTGKMPPNLGGKPKREMDLAERLVDREARLEISTELGHGREDVVNAYLGY